MRICSKFVQLRDSKFPIERKLQLQNSNLKTWKTLILKCLEFNAYFAKVVSSKMVLDEKPILNNACHVLSCTNKICGRLLQDDE